jgi:HK97 gp10 family phage protein
MGVVFNKYGAVFAELAAGLSEAVRETVTEIEQDVKGRAPTSSADASPSDGPLAAPFITGNLRRSYHVDFKGTNGVQIEAHVGSDPGVAPYAVFVEYGTSKMAPRPHLTPSSEAQRVKHDERVAAVVVEAAKL